MTEVNSPFMLSTPPPTTGGNGVGRFTHQDFVQYLQNIDDMASPPAHEDEQAFGSPPSSTKSESPRNFSGYTPTSKSASATKQSSAVSRTLKSRISDLERENKSLTEDFRRTTRELDRKGGGAGEGVHWFSATTMKTKLKQVEAQWSSDLEKRVSQLRSDADATLEARLAEQGAQLHMRAAHAVDEALAFQKEQLTQHFESEAARSTREFEQRFKSVLADVEGHKQEVSEAETSREAEHATTVQHLEAQVADLDQELRASREVEAMGRSADSEASASRHRRELQALRAELEGLHQESQACALEQTLETCHQQSLQAVQTREAELGATWQAALSEVERSHSTDLASKVDAYEKEAHEARSAFDATLEEAKADKRALESTLEQEKQANQETLSKLLGLKSSATEAQLKKANANAVQACEDAVKHERALLGEAWATEKAALEAAWEAKGQAAVAEALGEAALQASAELAASDAASEAAVEKAKDEAKAAQSVCLFEQRGAHFEELTRRDAVEVGLNAEVAAALQANRDLKRDTLEEVDVIRERLRAEKEAAVAALGSSSSSSSSSCGRLGGGRHLSSCLSSCLSSSSLRRRLHHWGLLWFRRHSSFLCFDVV